MKKALFYVGAFVVLGLYTKGVYEIGKRDGYMKVWETVMETCKDLSNKDSSEQK